MARTIRFHLDEHGDSACAAGLRRRGIDVTTTVDARLLGAEDPDHLAHANAECRVIFTNDNDFLRLHGRGTDHPGIVYCHQQTRSVGDVIRALELIWEVFEPEANAQPPRVHLRLTRGLLRGRRRPLQVLVQELKRPLAVDRVRA